MEKNLIAEVRFKDRRAGQLEQSARGPSTFTYDQGWDTPIGCALPLTPNIHVWANGVHPFFQHIAAEGWLRQRQARAGVVGEDDDFAILLRYGRDCIGAVSVNSPQPFAQLAPDLDPVARAALDGQRTISGVQKKLLVVKTAQGFAAAGPDGPAPFIAKFNSAEIDTLVRNEAFSLELARDFLGRDQVTQARMGSIDGFGAALVVTRFDRTATGEKLRLEDFAQILAVPRGRDNDGKYNSSYERAADAIRDYSARPAIDLERYFRLVVVNALLGNCDAHLKNFSLLETPEGLRLSPAYDIVNTMLYRGQFSTSLALQIDGANPVRDQLDRSMFERFGRNIGLPQQAITAALAGLKRRSVKIAALLRAKLDAEPGSTFYGPYFDTVIPAIDRILP
jgi:serine/threonine-protein kinase HipA